jgi:hypothetical protein
VRELPFGTRNAWKNRLLAQALSRAKRKAILATARRRIFSLFLLDEKMFANASC